MDNYTEKREDFIEMVSTSKKGAYSYYNVVGRIWTSYAPQNVRNTLMYQLMKEFSMSIYNYKVKTMNNDELSISAYDGKVLLIVNTATRCGFTKQYNGLQDLYARYKDEGFEILDFPCNQFAEQAPESNDEIHDFCRLNFGIKFQQFSKIDVNGKSESALYTFLKKQKTGLLGSSIKWNFTKFLVDRQGNVVARYSPKYELAKIELEIKKLLSKE